MSLPELIEIVPLDKPVHAEITVPGSKSITNRALILAALADGEVTLEGALWSEDTQIMVECLQELGFMVDVKPDPNEDCNRTITVYGKGGVIPPGGTEQQPMELFVGNAGTAARFLAAFVCLGKGVYRLHGVPRMHERPQAALFKALRELGYRVESEQGNDKLPVKIFGKTESEKAESGNALRRSCKVSIAQSSQFASALLLCASVGGWNVEIAGENAEESPYVVMTSKLIEAFPHRGGKFQIEPDASSGSYFWAASEQELTEKRESHSEDGLSHKFKFRTSLTVKVSHWPRSGWQIDERFFERVLHLQSLTRNFAKDVLGLECHQVEKVILDSLEKAPREIVSRQRDLGDSIMTAIVMAVFCCEPIRFTDLGRLRVQECERVVALRTELTKCGAKVIEEGDTLTVYPSQLHGAEIETYNDHRMAMCFAILGLKVPGIKIKNPACVKKTFPNFFQKLAALPPKGLGATILDAKTGRRLTHKELFAD
ncbi:MAG TPA: 3-phosphoshikimate 1-carboxyvinyltransferase [Candidatus Paceibacterota bacterium]|nr:3-phosphoshikimate 1-carboxyvinyltransferase [Candidatus Paceibacterota bacterium]